MAIASVKRWNPFIKFGVPLISLTVLGSVALAHLQQGRKDVLNARDEKEWERMAANKALTREGVVAGAVADAVAKKKPLNLEEELQKQACSQMCIALIEVVAMIAMVYQFLYRNRTRSTRM